MKTSECKYCSCLFFSTNALARKVEKLALQSWKPSGLSPSHAYLLMMVIEDPGVQPGCLSQQLQLTPSTITRLIEKLEQQKLVHRSYEGKATNVHATPKGKAMLHILQECTAAFNNKYSAVLGKDESAKMVRNMNKVSDKLEV